MSLRALHLLFISAAAVTAFGFSAWCLTIADEFKLLGGGSAVLGVCLLLYGVYFYRSQWSERNGAAR